MLLSLSLLILWIICWYLMMLDDYLDSKSYHPLFTHKYIYKGF